MKARIINFRRGRHTQETNQFLLEIEGCDSKAKTAQYMGSRVVWTTPAQTPKKIFGKITGAHGTKGLLRARFTKGLPGTALGTDVEVLSK